MKPSKSIDGFATLNEFQRSSGVGLDDQIILVNNAHIFDDYQPCFFPWGKFGVTRFVTECWKQKLIFGPGRYSVGKGKLASRLFAGFYDCSFNNLDLLNSVFAKLKKKPKRKFELVVGKGDYTISDDVAQNFPANISKILANNVNTKDDRFRYLPMGRDFRSLELFPNMRPQSTKTKLCYCNYSISTHPIRQAVFDSVKEKEFIDFDHMGQFRKYSITREEFFAKLSSSKFCICPRGNAFDTFRMWDSLYVGTIPIIVREAKFHDQLNDLPILFLDSYEQFGQLDREYLESKYEEMSERKYAYHKLTRRFWLEQD